MSNQRQYHNKKTIMILKLVKNLLNSKGNLRMLLFL